MEKLKEILLKFFKLESIYNNVTGYVESRVALVKLEIREEVAQILSRSLIIMLMFLAGFLFVLFLSIGLAEYLNGYFEGPYAGYVIMAGFFAVVLLILVIFRKALFKSLEKQFVEMIKQKQD